MVSIFRTYVFFSSYRAHYECRIVTSIRTDTKRAHIIFQGFLNLDSHQVIYTWFHHLASMSCLIVMTKLTQELCELHLLTANGTAKLASTFIFI